jgi:hypothetical protein
MHHVQYTSNLAIVLNFTAVKIVNTDEYSVFKYIK